MPMTLEISRKTLLDTEIRRAEEQALVVLRGELDLSTASQLFNQLAELSRAGVRHVALDLGDLAFTDSTGLSVIVAEHKRVESLGGELIIFSPQPNVRRLFEVSGLSEYLTIRPATDASSGRTNPGRHVTAEDELA
jgi:stage II sporulation protein AA (anti-sigma F factor antagonist)